MALPQIPWRRQTAASIACTAAAIGCMVLAIAVRDSPLERPLFLATVILAFASPRLADRVSVRPPSAPDQDRKLRGVQRLSTVGMLIGFVLVAEWLFLFLPSPAVNVFTARAIEVTAVVFVALVVLQNVAAERLYRSLAATSTQLE